MQRSNTDKPLDASGPGERARAPQPHIGDADNVQKTTYVTGHTTSPEVRDEGGRGGAPTGAGFKGYAKARRTDEFVGSILVIGSAVLAAGFLLFG